MADDDGKLAGDDVGLSDEQQQELTKLIHEKNRTVEKFCAYAKIENLAELPVGRFEAACNYVRGLT
jgi:hypothetical protein